MATVLAASFGPDRLFQVFFPYQNEHPQAFVQALEEALWLSWYDYRKVLMVSYHDASTQAQQQQDQVGERTPLVKGTSKSSTSQVLTGVAEWERAGAGWESLYGIWGRWDPRTRFQFLEATAGPYDTDLFFRSPDETDVVSTLQSPATHFP
jgi:hypothetical protein